jgi:acyl carrier protein
MTAQEVMDIYSDVLETTGITPDSDFFALGGDSLLATRVLSAVARLTGLELTFDDFILAPTPNALAKRVESVLA